MPQMNKTALLTALAFALAAMTACNGVTADKDIADTAAFGEAAGNAVVVSDTAQPSSSDADTTWDELERLTDEIYDGHPLEPTEWTFIFDHIDRFDGYLAEGFGYAIYNQLVNCPGYNEQITSVLNTLPPLKREHVLNRLVGLMSVDILLEDEKYTWAQFVNKVPVFSGSVAAEKALTQVNIEYDETH